MNYEQRYKEILKAVKELQETNPSDEGIQNWVNDNVPELKESEDEKIRKGLIENFKWFCGDFPETTKWGKDDNMLVTDIIAWLEKQGERDARYENLEELLDADTIYQMAMNDAMVEEAKTKAINALSELEIGKLLGIEKQGEHHIACNEEQMKVLDEVITFAANHESPYWNYYIFGTLNNLIRQLKKLKGE